MWAFSVWGIPMADDDNVVPLPTKPRERSLTEAAEEWATVYWAVYSSLLAKGFTPEQALPLTRDTVDMVAE